MKKTPKKGYPKRQIQVLIQSPTRYFPKARRASPNYARRNKELSEKEERNRQPDNLQPQRRVFAVDR